MSYFAEKTYCSRLTACSYAFLAFSVSSRWVKATVHPRHTKQYHYFCLKCTTYMYVCTWVYNLSIVQVISSLVFILIWICFVSEIWKSIKNWIFEALYFWISWMWNNVNCTPQIFDILNMLTVICRQWICLSLSNILRYKSKADKRIFNPMKI